jgi:6-phosphogluconolactonase
VKYARPFAFSLAILSAGIAQALEHSPLPRANAGEVYTMTNAANGNAVMAFRRAADGTLTPAGTYPTGGLGLGRGLGNQGGLGLSDDDRWLFVVDAGSDTLSVFAVTKDGLKRTQTIPSQGSRPVSVTSSDDLVYVLNAGSDTIAGFRMTRKGTLEPIADSNRPLSAAGTAPAEIQFSPDGRALVITEKATNRLVVYAVDRDGVPETAPQIVNSAGQTPFGFSFGHHRDLFVSEAAGGAPNASSVSAYHLTRDGDLTLIDGSVPTGLTAACWVVVTPDGRYLYAADLGSHAISGYAIDRSGALTLLDADGSTADTGANSAPVDMAISDDGRFLYALSGKDHTLHEFGIASDGSLVPIGTLGALPQAANGLAAH